MPTLKTTGRQIAQPNAPDLSGAAAPYEAIRQGVSGVGKVIGAHVEKQRKAADDLESAVLYTGVSHALNKNLIELGSPENIAQGDASQRYVQTSKSIILDAIGNAPAGTSKELKNKLDAVMNANELKLLAATQKYTHEQSKAQIDIAIDTAKNNYKNALPIGDKEGIQKSKEEVIKLYEDGEALGLYTAKEKYDAIKELRETDLQERWYKRGEMAAAAAPGTFERELNELVNTPDREFPEEGTNEERELMIEAFYKGGSVFMTRDQAMKAINAGNVSLDILNEEITNPEQIKERDLTALTSINKQIELWKFQNKKTKNNDKLAKFLQNVQQGNGKQNYPSSPEIKEEGHSIYQQLYLQQKREKTGDPEAELTIEDEANILKQMNVNIPSIDAQLNYAIENADLDSEMPLVEWALGMIRTVGKETPNAIKLDSKNMAIANLANESLQYGRSLPRSALEGARATVNVDDVTLSGRRARQYKNGWDKEMRQAFKEMTDGADPDTNPTAWGAFKSIYSTQAMLSDNQAVAREGARQVMTPAFGESKFFPEKSYGYLPPEQIVPFGQQGKWLESQINMKLVDIAEANHNAPLDQVSNLSKIELGGDPSEAKRLVEQVYHPARDQMDLYRFGIAPKKQVPGGYVDQPITYRVNGHDRQVYLEADASARLNEGGKLTYSVYTINPNTGQKEPVMDPRNRTGFATITIDPLNEFLPGVYEDLNNKLYDEAATETARKQYRQKRPFLLRSLGEEYLHVKAGKEEAKAQIKKNEEAYNKKEETLKTSSGINVDISKKDVLDKFNNGAQ